MLLKSKKLSLAAVLALLGATIVAPPAWAAPGDCSVSGSIMIADNVVTGYTTCTGSVEIPNTVTSIVDNALQNANLVTSITFEAGSVLTSIGDFAFDGATSLTELPSRTGSFQSAMVRSGTPLH